MLEITDEAQTVIQAAMAQKDPGRAIRIYLGGGCGASQLMLGLDQVQEGDHRYDIGGFTYVVDKALSAQVGRLKVDYVDDGIREGILISSANPLPQGPSCGAGCSC